MQYRKSPLPSPLQEYTHIHANGHLCSCTHMHTYACACAHTHTHTHTTLTKRNTCHCRGWTQLQTAWLCSKIWSYVIAKKKQQCNLLAIGFRIDVQHLTHFVWGVLSWITERSANAWNACCVTARRPKLTEPWENLPVVRIASTECSWSNGKCFWWSV